MAMLEVSDLHSGYGDIEVLHGIDLTVGEGEIVSLIGSNGAGKTTTILSICGRLTAMSGSVTYDGEEITDLEPHEIVERGIIQVPEDGDLFTGLTVMENLRLGAQRSEAKQNREENIREALELFPRLEERENQRAGTMSGGEQQMLTIARALVGEPELLILDEPSIGLAPDLVDEVFEVIEEIHESGLPVLVVEQNVRETLELVDRGYVLENGEITMEGTGDELLEDDTVVEAYLGV